MLKKLKQKNINRFGGRIFLTGLVLMLVVGVFTPVLIKASDLSADQITVTTDILIDGKPSNYIKIGQDGSKTFQVQVKLNTPSQLQIGTDTINFPAGLLIFNTSSNRILQGFGATVTAQNATGGGSCFTDTKSGKYFAGNSQYAKCDGPLNNFDNTQRTIQQGQIVYTATFTLDQNNLAGLGINQLKTGNNLGLNKILVYPGMNFNPNGGVSDFFVSLLQAGKTVYVQLYDTQAAANADAAVLPTCTPTNTTNCVPAYGSTTGGGAQVSETGGQLLGFINQLLVTILGFVNEIIYFVFYWLIAPLVQAMLSIHTYQDQFVNVIYPGWVLVRNICNIFFIIAIIAMAMATLFRLEGYQFRQLLVRLVIAALLVNFSLVIGQVILGFADTMQSQFLPNNVDVIRSLARDLMVANTRDAIFNVSLTNLGSFSYTVTFFFWVALAVGSFCVFAAIAVFLVIRIIALWVLLMLSPVAYVAGILPATGNVREQWWGQFLKYAFFTPVMAFFLNMAAVISNNSRINNVLSQITDASFASSNAPAITSFVFQVASNIMLLVFLILAIKTAEQFGVMGAGALTEIAQKGLMRSFQPWTWPGASYLQKKKTEASLALTQPDAEGKVNFGKKVLFAAMNPKTTLKGYQHQRDEKKEMVNKVAEGRAFDIARHTFGGPPSEEGEEKQDGLVNEYKKNNPYRTTDQMIAHFNEIAHFRGTKLEQQIAYEAAIQQLAENKDMNDLLNNQGFDASTEGYLKFLNKLVNEGKLSEGRAARLAEKLSSSAFGNNEFWYGWGSKDGHIIKLDDSGNVIGKQAYEAHPEFHKLSGEKLNEALASLDKTTRDGYKNYDMYGGRSGMLAQQLGKFAKKEPQDIARNLHHSAVRIAGANGESELTDIGAHMIFNANDKLYNQQNRANAETVKAFIEVVGDSDSQQKLAQLYIDQEKARGVELSQAEAISRAKAKINEFSTRYLGYNLNTKVRVDTSKDNPVEVFVKSKDLDANFKQIKDTKEREVVVKRVNEILLNPSTFNYGTDAVTTVGDPDKVRDALTEQIAENFSERLAPKEVNITVKLDEFKGAQDATTKAIVGVVKANPSVQMKDLHDQLAPVVDAALKNQSGFSNLSDEQIKALREKILEGAK